MNEIKGKRDLNWYLSKESDTLTDFQKEVISLMKLALQLKIEHSKIDIDYYKSYEIAKVELNKVCKSEDMVGYGLCYVYTHTVGDVISYLTINKKEKPKKLFKTYIITDFNGNYKIGKSVNPDSRLKSLQLGNPNITLIAVVDCDIEKIIHNELSVFSISNEWFKLEKNQLKQIIKKYNFNFFDS